MEFREAVAARHSTRRYSAEAVPAPALERILEAGDAAPVGMGRFATVHISVVAGAEAMAKLHESMKELFGDDPLYNAPSFILVSSSEVPPLAELDGACIVENMLLAAADEGLSGCYIYGAIPKLAGERALLASLGVPEGFRPVSGLLVGYPEDRAELAKRKELGTGKFAVTRL